MWRYWLTTTNGHSPDPSISMLGIVLSIDAYPSSEILTFKTVIGQVAEASHGISFYGPVSPGILELKANKAKVSQTGMQRMLSFINLPVHLRLRERFSSSCVEI